MPFGAQPLPVPNLQFIIATEAVPSGTEQPVARHGSAGYDKPRWGVPKGTAQYPSAGTALYRDGLLSTRNQVLTQPL